MITTKENIIQYFQRGIKNKIIFAGVDFIGGKLIGDINITSPTGLKTYKDLSGKDLSKDFWNYVENKYAAN